MPDGFAHLTADEDQIRRFADALFRYADEGTFVSLRAFCDNKNAVFHIQRQQIGRDNIALILSAATLATRCANAAEPVVFCPPIATFTGPDKATEKDLANGLALSVECDQSPLAARQKLESLLGPATVIVASGGTWVDPATGEVSDKLHLHWRLTEPTRADADHRALKRARDLATRLVGGDPTSKPAVHPMRWPGSWHRKNKPRLASIVSQTDAEIDLAAALERLAEAVGVNARPVDDKADDGASGEDWVTDQLISEVLRGADYHAPLVALAMRFLKGGMPDPQVVLTLRGIMQAVPVPLHDLKDGVTQPGRWQARFDDIARTVRTARAKLGEGAPEPPRPLRRTPPPAEPFPLDALGVLRPAAEAVHVLTQAPVAMCAQSVLAAATLAAQAHGDVVLPYGAARPLTGFFLTLGASGERKSTVDDLVLKPVREREANLRETHKADLRDFLNDQAAYKAARNAAEKKYKGDRAAIRAALDALGPEPTAPAEPMLIADDVTPEGLTQQLARGQSSMGLFAPEGGTLIAGRAMNDDNRLASATLLNKLWGGEPIRRSRVVSGSLVLEGRRCSMHLMVQPGLAAEMLARADLGDVGLIARFLTVSPESTVGTRRFRNPDSLSRDLLDEFHGKLRDLLKRPTPPGREAGGLAPSPVEMDADARAGWIAFYDEVEALQAPGRRFEPIQAFASKLAEHGARLAGVLAVFANPDAPTLTAQVMECGITLARHYASEALRLYDAGTISADILLAEKLLAWLETHNQEHVSLPMIYQFGPSGIREGAIARRIAKLLVEHGYLVELPDGAEIVERGTKPVKRRHVWRFVGRAVPIGDTG